MPRLHLHFRLQRALRVFCNLGLNRPRADLHFGLPSATIRAAHSRASVGPFLCGGLGRDREKECR